ncbi:MAG: CarD family transcriptional regulator [Clostridiales bacterium]|nr:CarD family transcriptional regulator [Clostridiales bacterium]
MFKVGDNIFYPLHGAGTIESIEEKDILGESKKYYIMKMPIGDVKVMVPTENAENIGVRDISDKSVVDEVFKVFDMSAEDEKVSWSKRYRDNMDKMKTGDLVEIADVVRSLSFKQKEKGLSTGEKKMLGNAKQILLSELVLTNNQGKEELEEIISDKIQKAYEQKLATEMEILN